VNTRTTLDVTGAASAVLCAVHCVATALFATVLPLLGMSALLDERVELAFVLAAVFLGVGSMGLGWRRHRDFCPMVLLLLGLALLLGVRPRFEEGSATEVLVVVAGAAMLGSAHLLNLRIGRRAGHRVRAGVSDAS
jgi:hypothetical protein